MQVSSSTKKGEIVRQEEARPREVGSELVRINPHGDSQSEDKRALAAAKSPLLLCPEPSSKRPYFGGSLVSAK